MLQQCARIWRTCAGLPLALALLTAAPQVPPCSACGKAARADGTPGCCSSAATARQHCVERCMALCTVAFQTGRKRGYWNRSAFSTCSSSFSQPLLCPRAKWPHEKCPWLPIEWSACSRRTCAALTRVCGSQEQQTRATLVANAACVDHEAVNDDNDGFSCSESGGATCSRSRLSRKAGSWSSAVTV